jgi:hypothetical protein
MRPLNPDGVSNFKAGFARFFFRFKVGTRMGILLRRILMAEDNKREVRLNFRVPQPLKDKVVAEADKMGLSQSELCRYIVMTYFEKKEK